MVIRISNNEVMHYLIVAYFMVCLVPIGAGGLSINYSYLLYPIILLLTNKLLKPPPIVNFSIIVFLVIGAIAFVFDLDNQSLYFRRFASFIIFISIYSYAYTPVSKKMIEAFKLSIILISLIYSFISIFKLATSGLSDLFELKNIIGSQRYGFVYLTAMVLLSFQLYQTNKNRSLLLSCLIIIFFGLILSLSRSSIASLIILVILFFLRSIFNSRFYNLKTISLIIFIISSLSLAVYIYIPDTVEFYITTLITPLFNDQLAQQLSNTGSSEGIRLVRINEVIDYVVTNPLFGSGYLGIWAISETGSGSAHNQLVDTLLRVGFIGFFVYLYFGILLLKFLFLNYYDLFWSLIGILIYGLFHETFKDSQGAFILTFLIGMYSNHFRSKYNQKSSISKKEFSTNEIK